MSCAPSRRRADLDRVVHPARRPRSRGPDGVAPARPGPCRMICGSVQAASTAPPRSRWRIRER